MTVKAKAVTYSLPEDLAQWVEEYSEQTGRKKSKLVEMAIIMFKNKAETSKEVKVG